MKTIMHKLTIAALILIFSNSAFASIKMVKKQQASVEADASVPIDDSYINGLDENTQEPWLDELADNGEELDTIDEFKPKFEKKTLLKSNVSASDL